MFLSSAEEHVSALVLAHRFPLWGREETECAETRSGLYLCHRGGHEVHIPVAVWIQRIIVRQACFLNRMTCSNRGSRYMLFSGDSFNWIT